MSASTFSFLVWASFMVVMLIGLALAARRGRSRSKETEDVASKMLPEIGRVAEKTYSMRFGPIARGTPNRTPPASWYPPTKTRTVKSG